MHVFITGGLGFVGSNLSRYLLDKGHRVTAVGRQTGQGGTRNENYSFIAADTTKPGDWQARLKDADVVVNLAGKSIFKRWTRKYKQAIYESRILTTRNVVAALAHDKTVTLFSASGAGYYGSRGDDILKEDEPCGDDFLSGISVDWEKEALQAEQKGGRAVMMRFGVVIGNGGGAMQKMIPAYKFFVGGPIGSGRQWFPWIHVEDLMAAIVFIMENKEVKGPVNFCAPAPVRNKDLAKALGRVLRRPALMPAPAFMIRAVLGEFGSVLLDSQRVVPDKLLNAGFQFQYPDIQSALRSLIDGSQS